MTLLQLRGLTLDLGNETLSNNDREEALYTLINQVLFSEVKEDLKQCLFNDDIKQAYDIASSHMDLIESKTVVKKTKYDSKILHGKLRSHKRRGQFFSFCENVLLSTSDEYYNLDPFTLIELKESEEGYNTSWNKAIKELERIEAFDLYSLENKARISKFRKLLKRKARLQADKYRTAKNGKRTKYQKRERVVLPSQR